MQDQRNVHFAMEEINFSQLCSKGDPSITVACSGGHTICRWQRKQHLWLVGERERERERESSWSTIKQKERSIEIGGEINWDDVFYFATSYCKRTRIRKKKKKRKIEGQRKSDIKVDSSKKMKR